MLKQIFIINQDLKMDKGKIAVQCCHGEVLYMESIYCRCSDIDMVERFHDWREDTKEDQIGMMKKIVLKSAEKEILEIIQKLKENNIWYYKIYDKGLTQVKAGSFTVLIVEPLEESRCDTLFGNLKLL